MKKSQKWDFQCQNLDFLSKMPKSITNSKVLTHQNSSYQASIILSGFQNIHSITLIPIMAKKNIISLDLYLKNVVFDRKWPYLKDFSKNWHLEGSKIFFALWVFLFGYDKQLLQKKFEIEIFFPWPGGFQNRWFFALKNTFFGHFEHQNLR